jgi:hypothetical protein
MTINEAIWTYLNSLTALTDVVGDVWSNHTPEAANLPSVVVALTATDRGQNLSGPTGIVRATFTINIWSESFAETGTLGEIVRLALSGYTGPMGDKTCIMCRIVSDSDSTIVPDDASASWVYQKSQEYRITMREPT